MASSPGDRRRETKEGRDVELLGEHGTYYLGQGPLWATCSTFLQSQHITVIPPVEGLRSPGGKPSDVNCCQRSIRR